MKTNFAKLFKVIIFILGIPIALHSQTPNWSWAKTLNDPEGEVAESIDIDNFGNVYAYTNLRTGFGENVISKWDSLGNLLWVKKFGGQGFGNTFASTIAINEFGFIYVSGFFSGTVDFDPSPSGTFNLTMTTRSGFISKLDDSGNFVWVKAIAGTANVELNSLVINSSDLFVSGDFFGTIDFDPSASATFNLTAPSSDSNSIFISRYDTSGNFIWAKAIGPSITMGSTTIALDDSCNVYTSGHFLDEVDFDPGVDTFNLSEGQSFLVKLDSSGNFVWAKSYGAQSMDVSITIDRSGYIYSSGTFGGFADFDPGQDIYFLTSLGSNNDLFISKLDNAGNFVWAKSIAATGNDVNGTIVCDEYENIFLTGGFNGSAEFDPGAGTYNVVSSGGNVYHDIFVLKLDSAGSFGWVKTAQGLYEDVSKCLIVDNSGNLLVTGQFQSFSIVFDATALTIYDTLSGRSDVFIAKMGSNSWRPCAMIPIYTNDASSFVILGGAYVGTGQDSLGQYQTTFYKFNPVGSGTWSSCANYTNAARARATGFSLNGNGFIGLGYDGSSYNDILEYFPSTDSWSTTSHALNWNNGGASSRYYAVSFTIGNTAYVGLGTNGSSTFSDFYSFDGTNWTQIADFPGGQRHSAVAFTIGDTAYVGTGMDASGNAQQDFYAYDPVNGWHTTPINMGTGNERANAVAFSIGRYGFVALGGDGSGGNCRNDLWQFDPSTNTFAQKTSLPSTELYNYAVGFSIGGKGYVCMGGSCDGTNPTNETWEYTPDNEVTATWIGINETNNDYCKSTIFPNPVVDQATINVRLNSKSINLNNINLSISNLLGQPVIIENTINKSLDGNINFNIQRGQLPSGFYIYKIIFGSELKYTGKFIIN